MNDLAPIAFFAFNRPLHSAQALDALRRCDLSSESDLHCFIDAPKVDADREAVAEVERIVCDTAGFKSVTVHRAIENSGLFKAITDGVNLVVSLRGRVIVVEDDLVVTPRFLAYMNAALMRYEHDPRIGSVHAYLPPMGWRGGYFFLRGADCWGWATWKDRWELFNGDARSLLGELIQTGRVREFCRSHGSASLVQLITRARGHSQSWAIAWHASLFLRDRLTLHPAESFVRNIGNDGSGIHAHQTSRYDSALAEQFSGLGEIEVMESICGAQLMSKFMDGGGRGFLAGLVSRWILLLRSRVMLAFEVMRGLP
jgi:hypothetical protein